MSDSRAPRTPAESLPASAGTEPGPQAARTVGRISGLLAHLIEDQHLRGPGASASGDRRSPAPVRCAGFENDLAVVRLGVAASLFYALRSKHSPTASHSLRVALVCSAWAERLRLDSAMRDRVEVAALLHDVGKIGIPDAILKKPGRLTQEEQAAIDFGPQLAVDILRGSTDDQQLLDMIRYHRAWYRSRREESLPQGDSLPLGARMLAIAEAFDSMTTDHVYRSALSRERALAELSQFAGTQFDPDLAGDYHHFLETRPEVLHGCVVQRWLKDLRDPARSWPWRGGPIAPAHGSGLDPAAEGFFRQLMIHTHDGVVFIDSQGVIRAWNSAMFHLSGVSAEAVCGNRWSPEILRLADSSGRRLGDSECPLLQCLGHGHHSTHQLKLKGPLDVPLAVNLRVTGVNQVDSGTLGVVAMFQDASQQATLEKRVRDLNERVIRDPLTGVANRAEFDRRLEEMTDAASDRHGTFSLVISDLDHFKAINDTYGHPAGDEVIVTFARLLSDHCRDDDLVARYGGEEFVVLCRQCDNAAAAALAEKVRLTLESTRLSGLKDHVVTASFGVTEFQEGDTSASVLARADRALLRAKDNGRNRVIQLGTGGFNNATPVTALHRLPPRRRLFAWLDFGLTGPVRAVTMATPVPIDLVIDKLCGFVADHKAEILRVGPNELEIRITARFRGSGRRSNDPRIDFNLLLQVEEQPYRLRLAGGTTFQNIRTLVAIKMLPARGRDRRRNDIKQGAAQVLASLRSYLMGEIIAG